MKWNDAQAKAIEIRDKNILVSAAAGSGKTAVLVERIKQLLIKDGIGVGELLVVTFTNAAAAEMKKRLRRELRLALASEENKIFLQTQLDKLSTANISTFHSFCIEIVRRFFHLADVEADFKICDEVQKVILQESALDDLFEEFFEADGEKEKNFIKFLNKYAKSKNEYEVKNMILTSYDFILSLPNPFEFFENAVFDLSADETSFENNNILPLMRESIIYKIEGAISYYNEIVKRCIEVGVDGILEKANIELDGILKIKTALKEEGYDAFVDSLSMINFVTFSAKKEDKENYALIKDDIKYLRDKAKGKINSLSKLYSNMHISQIVNENLSVFAEAQTLLNLVKRFDEIYLEKKRQKNLIDFNDAEHFALKLLENTDIQQEYRNKFKYIFIDEYQDSNIVQETLIQRIKRENNVFMVGDIKQSIYKFRLAEPEIFINKYEDYKKRQDERGSVDCKIDLNQNFRSNSGVIDATNLIFKKVMSDDTSGIEYDEDAMLYQGAPEEELCKYLPELYIFDEAEEQKNSDTEGIDSENSNSEKVDTEQADINLGESGIDEALEEIIEMQKTEAEANMVAKIIKECLQKNITDRSKKAERKIRYKDIVILFRSIKNTAAIYQEVFDEKGIPVFSESDKGYFDTVEVGTFLNLLKVIDNIRQDIPLLSVLRSFIFKFTSEELATIRIATQKGSFYQAFDNYSKFQFNHDVSQMIIEKCIKAKEKISDWKLKAQFMTLEEFLWQLMIESNYYTYVGGMPLGKQRQSNLSLLVDKAVSYQSQKTKGLFSFIAYVDQLKKTQAGVPQVKLVAENDDVVRLMTIHKSKGLEFPVVILAGLGRKFNNRNRNENVAMHKDIGLALKHIDENVSQYFKTLLQYIISEKEKSENFAEEIRILYVGFTRAMDRLILTGTLKDYEKSMGGYILNSQLPITEANSYFDLIMPAYIGDNKKIEKKVYMKTDFGVQKKVEDKKFEDIKNAILSGFKNINDDSNNAEISRRLNFEYPYFAQTQIPLKFSVTGIKNIISGQKYKDQINIKIIDNLLEKDSKISAAQKGTIMHKAVQILDLGSANSEISIKKQIDDMVLKGIFLPEEVKYINTKKVESFFKSEIGVNLLSSNNVQREIPFNLKKPVKEVFEQIDGNGEILIQGMIDCVYTDSKGKTVLIDYKTDYVPKDVFDIEEFFIKKYDSQLMLYKEAYEKIKKERVDEIYIYSFFCDLAIKCNI